METKAMEGESIAAILTAIGGITTGAWGGLRIGKSRQVEEVKELITSYKEANEFNKTELVGIKAILTETRQMHKECEDGRNALECQIDELRDKQSKMEAIIQKHIRIT